MKSLTEQQAEYYIKAGFFPEREEKNIDMICDLQDIFGHQRYWAIIGWLYKPETKENAEKLFRIIWAKDTVDSYIAKAESIHNDQRNRAEIAARISELDQELNKLNKRVGSEMSKMFGEENFE